MQIGDAVRLRADSRRRDVLGPVGDHIGIVVDVAVVDGGETLSVVFGDDLLLEPDVPASELELIPQPATRSAGGVPLGRPNGAARED